MDKSALGGGQKFGWIITVRDIEKAGIWILNHFTSHWVKLGEMLSELETCVLSTSVMVEAVIVFFLWYVQYFADDTPIILWANFIMCKILFM